MNKQRQLIKYLLSDFISAIVVWALFAYVRLIEFEKVLPQDIFSYIPSYNFIQLLCIVPFFWLSVYYISGYYNQVLRKSRLSELLATFLSSFVGSILLFFVLLIGDNIISYDYYYLSFLSLFLLQFFITYFGRLIITQSATVKIHNRIWTFNTLIIGTGKNAQWIDKELNNMKLSLGNKIIGFVVLEKDKTKIDDERILGTMDDLDELINQYNIKEIIIASDKEDTNLNYNLLKKAYQYTIDLYLLPNLYEIINRGVRMSTIYSIPLDFISCSEMPYWQQNIKRIFDIFASVFVLILFSPLYLFIAVKVKLSSPGSVFYVQERIGRYGKPFKMIKFRTMKIDAETDIPMLTTEDDERVTKFGKFLRKYRLDELPQFFNVLKGDMSFVGYRPERQYFIEKIEKKAPHYCLLQKIRPGITSWGMVKYGYANDVDKMVERLEYDIIYIENLSLVIDLKILIYTFKIIFNGRGI
jgi:exopolysaccharide biosynthesis polyprenyl glycosylphosphotransferase